MINICCKNSRHIPKNKDAHVFECDGAIWNPEISLIFLKTMEMLEVDAVLHDKQFKIPIEADLDCMEYAHLSTHLHCC